VPALAVRPADRVDRRQVEDVEAELGETGQLSAHAGEAAPRAREELVPRAEPAEDAVDVDGVGRRRHLLGACSRSRRERPAEGQVSVLGAPPPLRRLAGQISLAGRALRPQPLLERGAAVPPGLDPEAPLAGLVDPEGAGPDVVPERLEPRLAPARGRRIL